MWYLVTKRRIITKVHNSQTKWYKIIACIVVVIVNSKNTCNMCFKLHYIAFETQCAALNHIKCAMEFGTHISSTRNLIKNPKKRKKK